MELLSQFVPVTAELHHKKVYGVHLNNWSYLSTYLTMEKPDLTTIGILLRLELDGKCRVDIVNRLTGTLVSRIRDKLKSEVHQIITGAN